MKFREFGKLLNDFIDSNKGMFGNKSTEVNLEDSKLYIYSGTTVDNESGFPLIHGAIYLKCSTRESRVYKKDSSIDVRTCTKAGNWYLIYTSHIYGRKGEAPILSKLTTGNKKHAPGIFTELGLVFGKDIDRTTPIYLELDSGDNPEIYMMRDCLRVTYELKVKCQVKVDKRLSVYKTSDGFNQVVLETKRNKIWNKVSKYTIKSHSKELTEIENEFRKEKLELFYGEMYNANKAAQLYKYIEFTKSETGIALRNKVEEAYLKCPTSVLVLGAHTLEVFEYLLFAYCGMSHDKIVEFFKGDFNCKVKQLSVLYPSVFTFTWKHKKKITLIESNRK